MRTQFSTINLALCLILFGICSTGPVYGLTIASTFDTDAEGWMANPGEGSLAHFGAGGNPGGHIRITDIGAGSVPFGSGVFVGPSFFGDLTAFDNGTLSIDMATFDGGGPTFASFGEIQLSGGSDIAFLDIAVNAPPSGGSWQTFTASLDAASWGVTQAAWLAILANVTSIGIPTDAFDGPDTIGIDNFVITSDVAAIPLPGAALFMLTGLFALVRLRRRV